MGDIIDRDALNEQSRNEYRNEHDSYGDGDVPEIDITPYQSNATDVIPDEVPRRDGLGGN